MRTFALSSAAIALAASSLLSPLAQAQTSQIYIENAKTWGGGNTLYLYGVPIKNAVGDPVTKYWDLQVVLEATPDTARPNKATLSAVTPSSKLKKSEFVPGTYVVGTSATCDLSASPFNGRTEYVLSCVNHGTGYHYNGVWYTGPIAGHPEEVRLRAAKLDLIPGSSEYSWGKTAYAGGTFFGCFDEPELMSARQVGDTLTLINWGSNDIEDCRQSFAKQP